jgi:hypothetical protein
LRITIILGDEITAATLLKINNDSGN